MFRWDESYSIGHEELDNDHKQLFELINDAVNDFRLTGEVSTLDQLFTHLYEYTDVHFRREEDLFMDSDYPKKFEHLLEHNAFRSTVVELKLKSDLIQDAHKGNLVIEVLTPLVRWLIKHIVVTDQELCMFLNKKEKS